MTIDPLPVMFAGLRGKAMPWMYLNDSIFILPASGDPPDGKRWIPDLPSASIGMAY